MADPEKLAALEQYADTGTWEGAKARLGGSQDQALSRQSALGGLIGAPAAATATTQQTAAAPYGRFLGAVENYEGAYNQSKARMASAQDQYMGQVAAAQSAHRAEADRAIGEAATRYNVSSSSGDGAASLPQWKMEALARAKGGEYQQAAQQQEGQSADLMSKIEGGVTGARQSINRANAEQQATEDERIRAGQAYDAQHQAPTDLGGFAGNQSAREDWINEWAGSDRLGGPRSQRQQALEATNQERQAHEENPYNGTTVGGSGYHAGQEEMLANYLGPQFTRQAFVDLNLAPELGEEGQRLLASGMFADLTPQEEMDAAKARREQAYFDQTGYESPTEERSWTEAQRKNAGEPDPNSRQVRRPDDPDVMRAVGISPEELDAITNSPEWEVAIAEVEKQIEGDPDFVDPATGKAMPLPPVYSAGELRRYLAEVFDNEQMENLLVAMYGPSMRG